MTNPPVEVATVQDTVARATYTTNSFTAANNKLYLVAAVYTLHTVAGGTITGFTSTGGLTFDIIGAATGLSFSSGNVGLAVGCALVTSGAGAGTVSALFTNNRTGCAMSVIEWPDVDLSGTNGSGAIRQATNNTGLSGVTPSTALGAFGSVNNGTFGVIGTAIATIPTVGGNFTSVSSGTYNNPNTAQRAEYALDNQTTVDGATTGNWGMFACEIVAAATATKAFPPFSRRTRFFTRRF